jgi:hypothetical protein
MNHDNLIYAKAWLDRLSAELSFRDHESSVDKLKRLNSYLKAKERLAKTAASKHFMEKAIADQIDKHPV